MFGSKKKDPAAQASDGSSSPEEKHDADVEKSGSNELETIHTNERVGTHAQYYEKDGLRTEGDGVDHDGTYQKMTPKLFASLFAMSFLWVGSQIPLYLFGGITPDIYADIGGYNIWVWFVIGYLIPNAALCPFVGALSDMFGRRYVGIAGQVFLIVGPVVTSTANTMLTAIGGQVISGVGAGLNELIALAGTGELVPTAKRGAYVGAIVFTILPFAPSVLWAQLIVGASSWRYVGIFVAGWNFIGLLLVAFLYFPPPRPNSIGYTKKAILKRVDYVGGFFSIGGILCFMMGMQWGAQQYQWTSVHVLAPFCIGIVLIICFFVWEVKFARYPMVPHRIFSKAKNTMSIILIVTFLSGANFFVMLLFWPTEIYNVYGNDRVGIGIRSLPIGFGILGGAVISLLLIPITKGRIREILIFFTVMMTVGSGTMSIATPYNIDKVYPVVLLASMGVGGVIVPCSIIAQIICPDDLIATITAITLAIRYVGGAIGFTVYYNVFYHNVVKQITQFVVIDALTIQLQYFPTNVTALPALASAAAEARYADLEILVDVAVQTATVTQKDPQIFYNIVMEATHVAFAKAYVWPYYISIAFGGVCVILCCFLGDIKTFLDQHIAVVL